MAQGPLDGKVAVVTGAGRGIGRAIALRFAAAGATVVGTAQRRADELEDVARLAPGRLIPVLADVSAPDDCERVVDTALAAGGSLHVLVNNAARGVAHVNEAYRDEPLAFWQADPVRWVEALRTNVEGVFHMTRLTVPHLLERAGSSVILVSVNAATMVRRGFSPYGPSKAALEALAEVWRAELDGTGVRLNLLLPGGATDTGMIPAGVSPDERATLLRAEIMAEPALWLATGTADGQRVVATEWRNPEVTARQR